MRNNWLDKKYREVHSFARKGLIKPLLCSDCKQKKPLDLANISGKYLFDLSDWKYICRKCHIWQDRIQFVNLKRKLTIEQVKEIRKLYIPRIMSHRKLAKKYNVTKFTITLILNHTTFNYI